MTTGDESLAAETLRGDVRDVFLGHIRALQKPWQAMSELEQQEAIDRAFKLADTLVRGAVEIAAARGFKSHPVTIGAFKVDEGIECKFETRVTDDALLDLAHRQGHGAVLVPLDITDFLGDRGPAVPQPEQPDIPFQVPDEPAQPTDGAAGEPATA